jgi:hypothetical protein
MTLGYDVRRGGSRIWNEAATATCNPSNLETVAMYVTNHLSLES